MIFLIVICIGKHIIGSLLFKVRVIIFRKSLINAPFIVTMNSTNNNYFAKRIYFIAYQTNIMNIASRVFIKLLRIMI